MHHYYTFGCEHLGSWNQDTRNNNLYTGQERQGSFNLEYLRYKVRFGDPLVMGRFQSPDPLSEKFSHINPFNHSENSPIAHIDLWGLQKVSVNDIRLQMIPITNEDASRAGQGVLIHGSYTGVRSSAVRNQYQSTVSKLDPSDSQGRTQAKAEARSKTPAITRTIAEEMKPMSGEGSRVGGTASKTNTGVNSTVGKLGTAGRAAGVAGVGISVYNVASAEDKSQAIATEGGALTGAIIGGELGAETGAGIGLFFGGGGAVPGAIIGGVIGSIIGSITGAEVGKQTHDAIVKPEDEKK